MGVHDRCQGRWHFSCNLKDEGYIPPVCILTAGQGSRMGSVSSVINKSLLPYQHQAIISHIIQAFPKITPFVIALGYQSQQVRDYLTLAHPDVSFQFVLVDRYTGSGTGPGYSLQCCQAYLQQPFFFVSCDTLFKVNLKKAPKTNWIGVTKVPLQRQKDYCNVVVMHHQVQSIHDKQPIPGRATYSFTGLMFIRDYQVFWSSLSQPNTLIQAEHQISHGLYGLIQHASLHALNIKWLDLGSYEAYRKAVETEQGYDFSKTQEFLYRTPTHIIKFYADPHIVQGRVQKAALKPAVFPQITSSLSQWYNYRFVEGHTLYTYNNPVLFKQLLSWLQQTLWTPVSCSIHRMHQCCYTFYYEKTLQRLVRYDQKYPYQAPYDTVNGEPVELLPHLLKQLPWDTLCQGLPTFIHGDLQFDNILYNPTSQTFTLLDWRQDFAGEITFGDLYYDLAKLMGGIIMNYDYIKAGLFRIEKQENALYIDFAKRFNDHIYLNYLYQFIQAKALDLQKVQYLVGLIYLNMSPLHHPPFDQLLHALGHLILTTTLRTSTQTCCEEALVIC